MVQQHWTATIILVCITTPIYLSERGFTSDLVT